MPFHWTSPNSLPSLLFPTKIAAALAGKRSHPQIANDEYVDDNDVDEDSEPLSKKALIGPDMIVVVGGEEFEEHSQILCSWSGYFEGAFQRGTYEARTKRFESLLKDKNPEEWHWIAAVSAPFSNETVTKDNVFVALSWFDLLDSQQGLDLCDYVLKKDILDELLPNNHESLKVNDGLSAKVDKALDVLNNECPLPQSKNTCLAFLRRVLQEKPEVLSRSMIQSMLDFLANNTHSGGDLWKTLQSFLGDTASSGPAHVGLIENCLLSQVLFSEIQRKVTMDRMVEVILKHSAVGDDAVGSIRQGLKEDSFFAGKLPSDF